MYRIILTLSLFLANSSFASSLFTGTWQGTISTPGQALEIEVSFSDSEERVTGKISIPIQGLTDFALSDIRIEGESIQFAMAGIPGEPSFDGKLSDGGKGISGIFSQGGTQLAFEVSAGLAASEAARKVMEGFDDFLEEVVMQFNVPGLGIAVVALGRNEADQLLRKILDQIEYLQPGVVQDYLLEFH